MVRTDLPPIPAKRYFTIGEVSELCHVKPHVLRYWEQEFSQLNPVKRRGNRRYYQHHEVVLVRKIRELLYDEGFTISGARAKLAGARPRMHKPEADKQKGELLTEAQIEAAWSAEARLAEGDDEAIDAQAEVASIPLLSQAEGGAGELTAHSGSSTLAQASGLSAAVRSELEAILKVLSGAKPSSTKPL